MKVGVVIPSYNQGKYIEKTINSVIINKKHIDISIILMDGGSTDNTLEIIEKYVDYLDYWRSEKDGGQASAINFGIQHLKECDYVMWLNSDDVFENEYAVKNISEYAQKNGLAVCYGKSYLIDENDNKIGEYPTKNYNSKKLAFSCYISQPSVIIRSDAWNAMGGLNEKLKMCMDYELWIRLSRRNNFGYYNDFIGNTRIHSETKTTLMREQHLNEAIYIIHKNYSYVPLHWIVSKMILDKKLKSNLFIRKLLLFVAYLDKEKYINAAKEKLNLK